VCSFVFWCVDCVISYHEPISCVACVIECVECVMERGDGVIECVDCVNERGDGAIECVLL